MSVRLAIDAATDRLSVAAGRGGADPVERGLIGARHHAGALLGLIDEVLHVLRAGKTDIDLIAVADGPGGFTGLRVSFAAAKALARDGVTLLTAPSLLVRAATGAGSGERVLAVASALRGEVYAGAWQLFLPDRIDPLFPPRTLGFSEIALLPSVDRIVGDAPPEIAAALGGVGEGYPAGSALLGLIGVPGGTTVIGDSAGFEPNYGRPAEAQVKWEREHGRPLPSPGR